MAPEQFVIDLADFVEDLLHLRISGQTLAGLSKLRRFEQERLHLALGEAAVQIEEGPVFSAGSRVALAVGLATFEVSLDEGRVKDLRRESEGAQQMSLALA